MRIELPICDGDHAAFLRCVEHLLARDVCGAQPDRVYIARIDHWFGDRWFGFRGKVVGAVGFHTRRGSDRFIVPPFVSERVRSECCYERSTDGEYERTTVPERLAIHQKGGDNLYRWLHQFTASGILLWYSGDSACEDMASAMLYVHTATVTSAWYLGVRREKEGWRFHKGIDITKREFEECEVAKTA